MISCVMLANVLPSPVKCGSSSTRVVNGGSFAELTVKWPRPLVDLKHVHKKGLGSSV